jgi:hypothetical protein
MLSYTSSYNVEQSHACSFVNQMPVICAKRRQALAGSSRIGRFEANAGPAGIQVLASAVGQRTNRD